MTRNYSEMGRLGANKVWSTMTKEERSKEMSRRRKLGYEKLTTKLKAIREECNHKEVPAPNDN